jgi:hypothetical protein
MSFGRRQVQTIALLLERHTFVSGITSNTHMS